MGLLVVPLHGAVLALVEDADAAGSDAGVAVQELVEQVGRAYAGKGNGQAVEAGSKYSESVGGFCISNSSDAEPPPRCMSSLNRSVVPGFWG